MVRHVVIVCTRDRPLMLERFLLPTLRRLAGAEVPVLVVDQSADDATARLLEGVPGVRRITSRPGLSHGRNAGIAATTEDVIVFTDDDVTPAASWPAELLAPFEDGSVGAVCGRATEPGGRLLPGVGAGVHRWPANPFGLGSGFNLAVRRSALEQVGPFDPNLGAGARFRAGEDTDMLYRLLRAGWAVATTDDATVIHHDWRDTRAELRVHFAYGIGAGAQTAKHRAAGDRDALRVARREGVRHLRTLGCAVLFPRPRLALIQVAFLAGLVTGLVQARRLNG